MKQWSAEEQTMIDLMVLNGYVVGVDIDKKYTRIDLFSVPPQTSSYRFIADTEYEAIRKAFSFWSKHNG